MSTDSIDSPTPHSPAWLAVVDAARSGVLGTINDDGGADLVPFVFARIPTGATPTSGLGRIVSVVDHKPKRHRRLARLANVAARPGVTVLIERYDDDWSQLWWVRLRGEARVIESGPDHAAAIDVLVGKYVVYQGKRPDGAVLDIRLTDLRAWSARGVPPQATAGE